MPFTCSKQKLSCLTESAKNDDDKSDYNCTFFMSRPKSTIRVVFCVVYVYLSSSLMMDGFLHEPKGSVNKKRRHKPTTRKNMTNDDK